jgi:hypothetical protein
MLLLIFMKFSQNIPNPKTLDEKKKQRQI